jgi:hypothetical protein
LTSALLVLKARALEEPEAEIGLEHDEADDVLPGGHIDRPAPFDGLLQPAREDDRAELFSLRAPLGKPVEEIVTRRRAFHASGRDERRHRARVRRRLWIRQEFEGELFRIGGVKTHLHDAAALQGAKQDFIRDRLLHMFLNDAR